MFVPESVSVPRPDFGQTAIRRRAQRYIVNQRLGDGDGKAAVINDCAVGRNQRGAQAGHEAGVGRSCLQKAAVEFEVGGAGGARNLRHGQRAAVQVVSVGAGETGGLPSLRLPLPPTVVPPSLQNVTVPPLLKCRLNNLTNVVAIAASHYHCLALQANGNMVGWGENLSGQNDVPNDLTNVVAIAAGGYHSLALQVDGTVVGWGEPIYGQITMPAGLKNVVAIAAGFENSLALETDGSLVILGQPTSQAKLNGAAVFFNVFAVGRPPLSYQWQFNGTNLDSATNSTLTLNNVATNQAGVYSVTITNMLGNVTSSNAVLSVYMSAAPTMNAILFSGGHQFQFDVTGVPRFNYAVQASTNLTDWESLVTNTSPFTFMDTNAPNFSKRFFRSIALP